MNKMAHKRKSNAPIDLLEWAFMAQNFFLKKYAPKSYFFWIKNEKLAHDEIIGDASHLLSHEFELTLHVPLGCWF